MLRTGDTGTVGLRIDLRGNEAVDFIIVSSIIPFSVAHRREVQRYRATHLATITIGVL